jgi:hypothetical protein
MTFCAARGLAPLQSGKHGPGRRRRALGQRDVGTVRLRAEEEDERPARGKGFHDGVWTAGHSFGAVVDRNEGA